MQQKTKRKEYVTVEEASLLLNVAERTVRRMIKRGDLRVLNEHHSVRVDLDDIEAWNARKPHLPHPILARLDTHEAQISSLIDQIEELRQLLDGKELPLWNGPRVQQTPLSLSAAERRGLPAGTLRLVDFAKTHAIPVGTIKSFYNAHDIALEVYQRPGHAERNKQEWWITPEQHLHLANYLREQLVPFTPCDDCEQSTA